MADVTRIPTSVYRYYDRNNVLLYVGITNRGVTRNSEHDMTKSWWSFVVRQEVEHYPHRQAALEREKHLIRKYRPPFNTQHNPDWEITRAIYEASAGVKITVIPADARKLLVAVHHKLPLEIKRRDRRWIVCASRIEHNALAANLKHPGRVLLRAPKKVATLLDVTPQITGTEFTFTSDTRIPLMTNIHLHLKARHHTPLVVEMHEAVGEVAA